MDYEMDTCLQYESWPKKAESPCSTSSRNVHFGWLHVPVNDHESSASIDLGL